MQFHHSLPTWKADNIKFIYMKTGMVHVQTSWRFPELFNYKLGGHVGEGVWWRVCLLQLEHDARGTMWKLLTYLYSTLRIVNESPCVEHKHHAVLNSALDSHQSTLRCDRTAPIKDKPRSQARVHWPGLMDASLWDRRMPLRESLKDYYRTESAPLSPSLHRKGSWCALLQTWDENKNKIGMLKVKNTKKHTDTRSLNTKVMTHYEWVIFKKNPNVISFASAFGWKTAEKCPTISAALPSSWLVSVVRSNRANTSFHYVFHDAFKCIAKQIQEGFHEPRDGLSSR